MVIEHGELVALQRRLGLLEQLDCPLGCLSDWFHFMDACWFEGLEDHHTMRNNRIWNSRCKGVNRIYTNLLSVPI